MSESCRANSMAKANIDGGRGHVPRVMKVSTSGFRAWPARPVSDRAVADAYLKTPSSHAFGPRLRAAGLLGSWAPSATPTTPAWPRVSSHYSPVVAHTARVRKGTRHTQGGADPTWRRQPHGGRRPTNVHSVAL